MQAPLCRRGGARAVRAASATMIAMMMMTTTTTVSAEQRDPGPDQIAWDLGEIYTTEEAWNAEKERLEAAVAGLARFRGTLGADAATLREALDAVSAIDKELSRRPAPTPRRCARRWTP